MAKSAILSVNIVGDGSRASKTLTATEKRLKRLGDSSAQSGAKLSRMYQQLDKASATALKVGALSTALLGLTVAAARTGAALAPLAGLVAAVPGLAGAGAAGMATFKVATAGFGDAVAAAAEGGEKFAEATKGMAPAMAAAAVAAQGFNTQFAATRTLVQGNFWAGVAGEMSNLATAVMPTLTSGMGGVASAMNGVFLELLKVAQTRPVLDGVAASFDLMETILGNLAPAVAPFVQGLLTLVGASAGLTTGFSGAAAAAESFLAWSTRISSDGTLAEWFANGKAAAGYLGDALGALGSIIGSVAGAALAASGDGGGLGGFAAAMQRIAAEIARPEIQSMLITAFQQAGQIISAVTTVVIALLPYLIQFGPAIMAISVGWRVASTAVALFSGAAKVVSGVITVAKVAFAGLTAAINVTKGAFMLLRVLLVTNPIGLLVAALIVAGVAFMTLYRKCEWFRNGVNRVAQAVAAVFKAAWAGIVAAVSAAVSRISALVAGITRAASAAGRGARAAFQAAVTAIKGFFGGLVSSVSAIFGRITGIASGAAKRISGVFSRIKDAASSAGSFVGGLFSSGTLWVKPVVPSTLPPIGEPFYLHAASTMSAPARLAGRSSSPSATVVNITIQGAIDPNETARQIRRLLERDGVRDGRFSLGVSSRRA